MKKFLGREPSKLYLNDFFFRNYFFELLQGRIKMTGARGATQGAAAQALIRMNAIAFARASGLDYVHTPFTEIAHADRPIGEWVSAWEFLFNLGVGETSAEEAEESDYEVINFAWHFRPSHVEESFVQEFRQKYYLNKSPRRNEVFTVGVHIRRGDVAGSDHFMWTDIITIARTVSIVRSILETHLLKYNICVFSQGIADDFVALKPAEFFLNADPLWTMQELIEADVLIMAKGTFSYVAAVLSDGIKLYDPWPLRPMTSWLSCHPTGDFDVDAFERQLHIVRRKLRKRTNA